MWEDDYRHAQDKLDAPEHWQTKALQHMKEARRSKTRLLFNRKPMYGALAVGCIAFFIVLTSHLLDGRLDPMTDLSFERLEGGTREFFTGDPEQRGSLVGMERALGIQLSDLEVEGFDLVDVLWQEEGGELNIQYLFESPESTLLIRANNHTQSVETNSTLDEVPLGLYYRPGLMETIYIAEFVYDGIYIQVEGRGLPEEEFIEQLQQMLTFLN